MNPSDVEVSKLNGIYCEMANLLGEEVASQIHKTYRGQQITFPVRFYSKDYIAKEMVKEYDGSNVKQLATKYGYSEKWVRKIINENK